MPQIQQLANAEKTSKPEDIAARMAPNYNN